MKKSFTRKQLLENPTRFGLDLDSKKLLNILKSYEDRGLLPRPISLGYSQGRGATKRGYYFPTFINMIKDIQHMRDTRHHTLLGIKEILKNAKSIYFYLNTNYD